MSETDKVTAELVGKTMTLPLTSEDIADCVKYGWGNKIQFTVETSARVISGKLIEGGKQ